jgi:pimeloyl-ACP methyl ester carboxylesterase
VKEIVMPQYADFFVNAGIAVLLFDYRNFGGSDGEPRQHLDPYAQIEDYKTAITFAQTLPEVDPERLGIWGISYSGGHVLCVGGTDPRVKCIVSTMPVVEGYKNMRRSHGPHHFARLQEAILEDRKKRLETGKSEMIAMSTLDPENTLCTWPYPEATPVFEKFKETVAPLHVHENTIESVELLKIDAFNTIPSPDKKLFIIPEASHMTLYTNRNKLEIAGEAGRDWFVEHLIKPYE